MSQEPNACRVESHEPHSEKKKMFFFLDKSQLKLSQTWVIMDLKVNWIDKNTNQYFALLLVDKNSVKNQTASKVLIENILNLQTCFESPGIERASLSTCRNGSP